MTEIRKIYIASPLGFSEAGREFLYSKIIPLIKKTGFEVLDPWVQTPDEYIKSIIFLPESPEKVRKLKDLDKLIGENNFKALKQADGMVAVLDGTDVDSGTASEIGYATAMGIPIIGYRGDFRLSSENIGTAVNLQVEYFVRLNGGTVIREIDELEYAMMQTFFVSK